MESTLTRWTPVEKPAFEFGHVVIIRTTDNGLLLGGDAVENVTGKKQAWIPRVAVHDEGEIRAGADVGDEGTLFVRTWLAEKEGWTPP